MPKKKNTLTPKEKLFCKYYTSRDYFCNWVRSYMKANANVTYDTAKNEASVLLAKPYIMLYIGDLLDWLEVNQTMADRELAKLMLQDEERWPKLGAIRHFNELHVRVEKARQEALDDKDITTDVLTIKLPE